MSGERDEAGGGECALSEPALAKMGYPWWRRSFLDKGPFADPVCRGRMSVMMWAWFALVWAWFLFRMWRGSAHTEHGDFNHFFWAAEALRDGEDLYESGRNGYLYPPLVAWVLQPLVGLGLMWAERSWAVVNISLTLVCMWMVFRRTAKVFDGPTDGLTLSSIFLVAMLLTFGPMRAEFEHGQTDSLVLLGFCLGMVVMDRVPWLAGAALGLAVMVKHHAVLALIYMLVRRRWRAAGAMVGAGVGLALLPAVQLGWVLNLDYLRRCYGYLGSLFGGEDLGSRVNLHPMTWELSISVPSAIARGFDSWRGVPMGPVVLGTLVVGMIVLVLTWSRYQQFGKAMFVGRSRKGDQGNDALVMLEWCGVIIALLAFSPQSITRHTFILLPVHVVAAYVLLVPRRGVNKWPIAIGILGYQLAARLPPGEERFEIALAMWRSVSGAVWFMLLMWIGLVWSGLDFARCGEERESGDAEIAEREIKKTLT